MDALTLNIAMRQVVRDEIQAQRPGMNYSLVPEDATATDSFAVSTQVAEHPHRFAYQVFTTGGSAAALLSVPADVRRWLDIADAERRNPA